MSCLAAPLVGRGAEACLPAESERGVDCNLSAVPTSTVPRSLLLETILVDRARSHYLSILEDVQLTTLRMPFQRLSACWTSLKDSFLFTARLKLHLCDPCCRKNRSDPCNGAMKCRILWAIWPGSGKTAVRKLLCTTSGAADPAVSTRAASSPQPL